MKVLQINTVYPNGSTGKIAKGIKTLCDAEGIECNVAYRYAEKGVLINDTIEISSYLDCHIHNRLASLTMLQGCFSKVKTLFFLRKLKKFSPDIIHLHNFHGSFINHKMLFDFLKKNKIKTVWTLHDCWSMTGFCPYFDMVECDKWQTECNHCPQKKSAIIDMSRFMHSYKKKCFSNMANFVLIANSNWTAEQAKKSFLKNYPIYTIYNGIDLDIFKPTKSDFRLKNGLQDKVMLLGVAFDWGKRKGLDVFVELSKNLPHNYKIVLVGTNDAIDKELPKEILSIHKTNNQQELAEIYSAADLFVNPTREEAFGLVNVEALACGTPVITFNTGGSPECIDETCGFVVEKDDTSAMYDKIIHICQNRPFSQEACIKRANKFIANEKFNEYIDLYKKMVSSASMERNTR